MRFPRLTVNRYSYTALACKANTLKCEDATGNGADHAGNGADHAGNGADHAGKGADHAGKGADHAGCTRNVSNDIPVSITEPVTTSQSPYG